MLTEKEVSVLKLKKTHLNSLSESSPVYIVNCQAKHDQKGLINGKRNGPIGCIGRWTNRIKESEIKEIKGKDHQHKGQNKLIPIEETREKPCQKEQACIIVVQGQVSFSCAC